jgi:TRAP-type C4-dicarboxylate transport system permease small subunit
MPQTTLRIRLLRVLEWVQVWASHLTIALTVGALTLQVISRELGWQVDWTEELARFSFLVMVFTSASYASGKLSHLRVSVFSDFAARWNVTKWVLEKIQFLCIVLFDVLFCWFASANVIEGLRYPTISPSLGFNESYLFLAPALFFAIATIQRFARLFDDGSAAAEEACA